ncbi:SDR family oxidoreductase [bacterium]|nr:MAG: SDR family oxidoreductase [bacterium]
MPRAVVTGGAKGIGAAVAAEREANGWEVIVLDREQVDLANAKAVEKICATLEGPIDLLVNNAGIGGKWKNLLETPVEEWDEVLAINLRAYWLMAKFLVPKMPAGSCIVNIASTRALMSEPNTEPYSASKGGVVALTHSLAISLSERSIRVNAISPGWIEVGNYEDLRPIDHEQHPVGRVGKPSDVARAVRFLADDAPFMTGQNLVLDGGMTVKMIYVED